MNTMKALVLLTLILSLASGAVALEQEGGARFLVGQPTGEFGEAVDNAGFGFEINYGVRPVPALTFGVGFNGMVYGSETQTLSLPLVEDFDLPTSNNLAGAFLYTQWRPLSGPVQPYVEARAGINYLWTESTLEDEDWWDDEQVARETNYDDFAAFWGGGCGLLIKLVEGDRFDNKPSVFLDLKVTHMRGAVAEYLTVGDITIVDNIPIYDASLSRTDLTAYELGVVLTF